MFNTLILEQDNRTAEAYRRLLLQMDSVMSVACFTDSNKAFVHATDHKVDLFIINIELRESDSGYHFAKCMRNMDAYAMTFIIFTAQTAEMKTSAYEDIRCYGYYVKPVSDKAFKQALVNILKYEIVKREEVATLFYKKKGMEKLKLNDIKWIDISEKTVRMHKTDGGVVDITAYNYTLTALEERLGSGFLRIRQSIIVNVRYIRYVDFSAKVVLLEDEDTIFKIGVRYFDNVKKLKEEALR